MTTTLFLIIVLVFLLVYFTLDARHDTWMNLEMQFRVKAGNVNVTAHQKEFFLKEASKYAGRWHAIDAIIKGYVVAFAALMYLGIDWGIILVFIWGMAIRWFWFDLNWNWFAGKEPWYSGSTAKTDKLTSKKWLQIAMKVFLVLISSTMVIIYFVKYYS